MKQNRRRFFYTTAWGGMIGMACPSLLASEAGHPGDPILIVLQLAGGNDGLNTVIPVGNDHYFKARPRLAIKTADVLKINDSTGLHPSLTGLKGLYDEGQLSIIEGVGYPRPNRSHFRSTEIWHTASDAEKFEQYGWLGRYFDHYCSRGSASIGLCVGRQNPQAFAAAMPRGITFNDPRQLGVRNVTRDNDMMMQMMGLENDDILEATDGSSIGDLSGSSSGSGLSPLDFLKNTARDADTSAKQIEAILSKTRSLTDFPSTRLSREMQVVARLIRGGMPTRIYYLSLGGFDTHTNQAGTHSTLLKEWSDAMQAFMKEMQAAGLQKRTCTLVFSEFGRRVKENASGGTDHGVAAPVYVLGGAVNGGLCGKRPSLAPADLDKGDLVHTVDFRAVYATLLEKHLGVDSRPVLTGKFDPMAFMGVNPV